MAVSHSVVDEQETDAAAVTSGSSFYLAMRILPAVQRDAMFQVYAFCRAVDDIADSDLPRAERNAGLDRWRADIDACFAGRPPRHLAALDREIRAFNLQRDDFHAMIDGMAMDAAEDICAPDEPTLDLFCDRVASAAGRLSVRIFGMPEAEGITLSHHLGRALQLTNILRDIDDDAAINRCYLPRELLAREGIAITDPATIVRDPALPRVCATLVERALEHFRQADAVMDTCPRAQVKAPRIMSGAYRCILEAAIARGFAAPRAPLRKPKARMLMIAARYALF
ncbi:MULTISPECIES: presqualene diphosphate synthase HpnD [Burkholderia]|uniref:Presqualene diphosphate synthase HpnD n=4 Tax=Burkholderia cenocepacia TaxID=95486 RepID=A0A142PA11_9BURK|nr:MULTISPECIES: presqualene diphosphate synthase HpnD [Burkholderia]AIO44374.1 squalene synthase HpnD [Burkholderia cepacia]ALV58408.1 phytoene synthase [Burkholderia cenocepacia]AMU08829.1 squalene synthase HpnD [Burkholderia cenocepacia]AMU12436.1 squalene synthase HpnD [Burkholderia cenocepacia]AOK39391.1 squalene synthase HpnD [Burkholderia cenocepacia]